MIPPDILAAINALCWHRLRVGLRCISNREAKRHPHFVMRSVLFHARSFKDRPLPTLQLHWRPSSEWWGERLHKGHLYHLDVFFPGATSAEIEAFRDNLLRHLADPANGFAAEATPRIDARSLPALLKESSSRIDTASDEICLDFLTPVTFHREDPRRPWLLDPRELGTRMARRLGHLGFDPARIEAFPWDALDVIPCYWTVYPRAETDRASALSAKGEAVKGCRGPLYLRGPWQDLLPVLLLAEELQFETGDEARRGQGAFRLATGRAYFDTSLRNPALLEHTWDDIYENEEVPDNFAAAHADKSAECARIAGQIAASTFEPEPAQGFPIEKRQSPSGEDRRIVAELSPRDRIVQRTLHGLMLPVIDRLLEHASVAYRPGRSVETARQMVKDALRAGCTHALETDIAAFFDEIEWPQLAAALDRVLPRADLATRRLLDRVMRQELRIEGRPVPRTKGILQGSPLSPLLANLYLDAFDERIQALGHHLIRYGDDLLILTTSEAAAMSARDEVRRLLAPLGLDLKEEKTSITPVATGLRFLGFEIGPTLDVARVAEVALRQTLFVHPDPAFLGLDHESLVVRRNKELVGRAPLYRIGCLIVMGPHCVSTGLLGACARRRIPIVFCSSGGHYVSTLRPDSRQHFEVAARQYVRHSALGDAGRLDLARRVVAAKLLSYRLWLDHSAGAADRALAHGLADTAKSLPACPNVEALRGKEGEAARRVFAHLQTRIGVPEFKSAGRLPHEKPDRFNALLDFGFWLLFSRINALLRGRGLSPYLGFLHSHKDHYESLVYDLMEPFRFRIDRLALNCIHLRIVRPEHFANIEPAAWKMTSDGMKAFVEAFEKDLATQRTGDPGTFRQLLVAQVALSEQWAAEGAEFRLFPLTETKPPHPKNPKTGKTGLKNVPHRPNLDQVL